MNVTNSAIYAIGVIIISLALIGLAVFAADIRGVVIGALLGYWFREGVSVTATGKYGAESDKDIPK